MFPTSFRPSWVAASLACGALVGCAPPPAETRAPSVEVAAAEEPVLARPARVERSLPREDVVVQWSFQAASPVAFRPTQCRDGSVYVPTAEGALHALGADGAFRWTYNVSGSFGGAGACDDLGNLYFGTTDGRLYVLSPDGTLRWVHRLPVGVDTNVLWSPKRVVFFGGTDSRVWAVSSRAGVLWRAEQRTPFGADVVLAPGGARVLASTASGLWSVAGLFHVDRAEVDSAPTHPPAVADDAVYVVVDGELFALSPALDPRWSRPGVDAVGVGGSRLVVTTRGKLCELRPMDGSAAQCAPLLRDAAGAPTVVEDHAVVVTERSLTFLAPDALTPTVVMLDATPLYPPTSAHGGVLVAAMPSGRVVALSLRSSSAEPDLSVP